MTGASRPAPRPTIYFVNQFSRHGHLDLYARLYSACALELGYQVVLIAEQESGVRDWLHENHPAVAEHFQFYSRHDLSERPDPGSRRFWDRVTSVWREQGITGLLKRVGPSVGSRVVGVVRLVPGMSRVIENQIGRANGVSFVPLVDEVLAAERSSGWPASLVFFLYLDMMNEDRRGRRYLDARFKRPWAGILFHPRHAGHGQGSRPERYFETRTARGAAFLNPHRLAPYASAFPDEVFGLVPDVTDATLSRERPELESEFTRRANGRTVVALIGSLTADKGLAEYLKVINHADNRRFFFVIIGEIFWGSLGADEPAIRQFVAQPPEHCFLHVGYVDDERQLNSMIAAADILYAVYPNQRDSANTLTKAAILEKPIVVNEAHLMGERVRAFNLGATVRCGDVDDILGALTRLRDEPRSAFGFAAYREAHSVQALKASFGVLVSSWIRAA